MIRPKLKKGIAFAFIPISLCSMFGGHLKKSAAAESFVRWEYVDVGSYNAAAIQEDGSLWVWGSLAPGMGIESSFEETGYSENIVSESVDAGVSVKVTETDNEMVDTPYKVMEDVKEVCMSSRTYAAIKKDGSLWLWGDNRYGMIGDGTTEYRSRAVKVMDGVKSVKMGDFFTLALKEDGSLWSWGLNNDGCLGVISYQEMELNPVKVRENIEKIDACKSQGAAIDKERNLWVWGDNHNGAIGYSHRMNDYTVVTPTVCQIPVLLLQGITDVSLGRDFGIAANLDSSILWSWGRYHDGNPASWNQSQESGDEENYSIFPEAHMMRDPALVYQVTAGNQFGLMLCNAFIENGKWSGSAYSWGCGDMGQTGTGKAETVKEYRKIMEDVMMVSSGENSGAAIKTDGSLWMWGSNISRALGNGTEHSEYFRPTRVLLASEHDSAPSYDSYEEFRNSNNFDISMLESCGESDKVVQVAPQVDGVAGILFDNGEFREVRKTKSAFSIVEDAGAPVHIIKEAEKVRAGSVHIGVLRKNHSLEAWGSNQYGSLGIEGTGWTAGKQASVKIMEGVSDFSFGGASSAAIKTDGSLWTWGDNSFGQLGYLTSGMTETTLPEGESYQYLPTKVMDDVKAVEINWYNCAAIKKDGSLWLWGSNEYGQIGNTKEAFSLSPVKRMEDVISVRLGAGYVMALKKDGSLWIWGNNAYGVLGNLDTCYESEPVKILEDVKNLDAGYTYCAAVKADRSLWTWGSNQYGQLGYELDAEVKCIDANGEEICTVPQKVMDDVSDAFLGYYSSYAVKTDGSLWAWGKISDYSSVLGNTTELYQKNPLKVNFLKEPGAAVESPIKGLKTKITKIQAKKKKLCIYFQAVDFSGVKYQIQYKAKGVTKKKNTSKTTVTLSKLKAKTTYSVRVRPYVVQKGKSIYGKWSGVKKKKTK